MVSVSFRHLSSFRHLWTSSDPLRVSNVSKRYEMLELTWVLIQHQVHGIWPIRWSKNALELAKYARDPCWTLHLAMDDEKLIEVVRDFTCLGQVISKSYKDIRAMENAWKEVANNVGLSM